MLELKAVQLKAEQLAKKARLQQQKRTRDLKERTIREVVYETMESFKNSVTRQLKNLRGRCLWQKQNKDWRHFRNSLLWKTCQTTYGSDWNSNWAPVCKSWQTRLITWLRIWESWTSPTAWGSNVQKKQEKCSRPCNCKSPPTRKI